MKIPNMTFELLEFSNVSITNVMEDVLGASHSGNRFLW